MHYSFDAWMRREYPSVKWARYADDGVIHCVPSTTNFNST
ncbi:RNA-directed DNA polymerase [Wolbachia endosymbiont of Armadillidium vulgare str. wVulC]|nr:hypothetical protein [Wolbachia endosymbiont of Armadillidium vulgare]KLT22143.1 RNA-directed DNA polymerase [Wolbachia endosymbiont of Armadillidium vulgare str. wVulC]KLT22352.1 RNA-directed DNA polymerase [Wolbachia endosymbiont of Armadillidium vulgare str. wVulC]KLT22937.1 RNA-directed DNA polymerase [Wolbachia endosymbiont of Armadillidium vulgare str. wVulC]KLT23154.1 RNA-directed DNA polymerase [Wolbachia endosymbiont of Armadillidium vulgare str. wVulC]